ncbi:hypothetical protein ETAA8_40310 [Anatilimnocola aggregata]|uniref:Uncharacterized protein n=1 Tax=Anatilimnocola aggregata TaxID=2528021 RepID=A0A517YFA7_9BACT|nr:hypothetical protein [Anatilimnocola aggregata]QDU28925.1 hypothetical protein ETAA8_40310 [Anatilimnocola aggregata]
MAITAGHPGHARLKFNPVGRPNEPIQDSLKVLVYAPLEVLVYVYLVTDGQGRTSALSFAAVAGRLKDINEFLTPQTGISFRLNLNERFTVAADLGQQVTTEPEVWAILDELNANADRFAPTLANISLYVVQRWSALDECASVTCTKDVRGLADPRSDVTGERRCIMEDDTSVKRYLTRLAHELRHTLGAEHDDDHGDAALMAFRKGEDGLYIYPNTVREIRGLP